MTTRILLVLTFVMAVAATLFAGTPSARADVTCTGTLGGAATVTTISGNVIVPAAASCTLSFVNVSGDVTVGSDANLLVNGYTEPSTIGGNVVATRCGSALLEGNVTVGGGVLIRACTNGPNGFQGPDVLIQGSFTCQFNVVQTQAVPCLAWLGKVQGAVTISSNYSPTASDVSLVTVVGTLDCESNTPATTKVHGPSWVDGTSQGQCAGFATTTTSIATSATPVASCAALAALPASGFPVPNTVITSAVDTPASGSLPERCIINGYVNQHVSPVDGCTYQDGFQVQLPLRAAWNGRFMMQGGGGTEGSVPTATGTIGGTTGITEISNGYAVVSQDGGHENTQLTACGKTTLEFYLDPLATIGNGYQSIEVSTLTAKYLINQYYGNGPNRSYWIGCSEGGRQGMVMSEVFPSFFDGIVAGDPVYDVQAVNLSEIWSMQQMEAAYLAQEPPLPPIKEVSEPPPQAPEPILYPAFPITDQALFETALLQACDALDGVTDGVVDNLPACQARFNPATAMYTDYAGALGPANTTYALQCTGAKTATCLLPAQIQAAIKISQGPRNSAGGTIQAPAGAVAPDHVDNTVLGYAYDGGWMTTVGIPSRDIGSSTSPPGNEGQVNQLPYGWISPPNPAFDPLSFNFNTELGILTTATPKIQYSTSLDIKHFVNYGHKIIWYHGLTDPGPPVTGTINYYNQMAEQFGGNRQRPELLTALSGAELGPLHRRSHDRRIRFPHPARELGGEGDAAGWRFRRPARTSTRRPTRWWAITSPGRSSTRPTTRSRLLCPYPQQARFTGKVSLVNGVPVASNPSDLASAANYACINFVQTATHDFNGDGKSDVLWRDTVEQHRYVADERLANSARPMRSAMWEASGRSSASATSTTTALPTFCGGIPAATSASG